MLASVLPKHAVSNIVYLHNSGAVGSCFTDENGLELQTTLIAKGNDQAGMCGVFVPNPYFGTVKTWQSVLDSMAPGKLPPFDKRADTVFWRGTLGEQMHKDCFHDQGNYDRFQAASLSINHPELLDVKFTEVEVGSGWNTSVSLYEQCEPYDENLREMIGKIDATIETSWYQPYEYANYKMLLQLPGKTSGSYSRNLNHLWATGSVILSWNSTVTEWYYPALVDGVTHLNVDYGNVVRKATRVLNDAKLADTLRTVLEKGSQWIYWIILEGVCPDLAQCGSNMRTSHPNPIRSG